MTMHDGDRTTESSTWPSFISTLKHAMSESPVEAVEPDDLDMRQPAAHVPPDKARWNGAWWGWGGLARSSDIKLYVEHVSANEARIVYVQASAVNESFTERLQAQFAGDELQGLFQNGNGLRLRMRSTGLVEWIWHTPRGGWMAGVLSQKPASGHRVNERIHTSMVEDGRDVSLEMVLFKPPGPGPFPTLVFHHGSTGMGNDPSLFTMTSFHPSIATFFNDRGWMVAFPQRRGRGKSDGRYDEGFEPDRSGYSGRPEHALPGMERALLDLDTVTSHLVGRADVDSARMLIGGQSRGGALSVAHAGTRPRVFRGVVNFVGGWVGDQAAAADLINTTVFKRGAAYSGPAVWLYAENDTFYSLDHSRKNHAAFVDAGGQAAFHVLKPPIGQDGHFLVSRSELWADILAAFMAQAVSG